MNQYKKGQIVKGCVTGIENYGIFVSLDDYYSGLIHISEISDFFVKNPADYVHIGETIRARVVDDSVLDSFHVRLSIKNMDYRFNRRYRSVKILETSKGFVTLGERLPVWISVKKQQIKENMQKNCNYSDYGTQK